MKQHNLPLPKLPAGHQWGAIAQPRDHMGRQIRPGFRQNLRGHRNLIRSWQTVKRRINLKTL